MTGSGRRHVLSAAAAIAAAALAVLAVASHAGAALVVDPSVTAGTPLPPNVQFPPAGVTVDQVAPGYAVWTAGQLDEFSPPVPTIHRLVDGGTVRPLPTGTPGAPVTAYLSGTSLVVLAPGNGVPPTSVQLRDVLTDAVTATFTVAGTDRVVATTQAGVVTVRTVSSVASVHLLRPDGTDVTVSGPVPPDIGGAVPAFDEKTVVYRVGQELWALDLATATTVRLTAAAPLTGPVRIAQTRVFWVDDNGFGPTATVSWAARGGGTTGSVTTAQDGLVRSWQTAGDALLAGRLDPQTSLTTYRFVDLTTGATNLGLTTSALDARSNGGVLVAAVADSAPGHIIVSSGGASPPLTTLPVVGRAVGMLKRSGARSVGAFASPFATQEAAMLRSGAATWTTGIEGTAVPGRPADAAGDVVLSWDDNPDDVRTRIWHITWPGGHRDVVADTVNLGARGRLVAVGSDPVSVQDARSGTVRRTFPATAGALALDGPLVWLLRPASATLVVTDTTGAQPDRTVPAPCAADTPGAAKVVAGVRWGVVQCPTLATWIVDLAGTAPAFRLADGEGSNAVVGNGFVVTTRELAEAGTFRGYRVVAVRSTDPAHIEKLYGPMGSGGGFGADDDPLGRTVVYSDTAQQPRTVSLPPNIGGPPHPDGTAPVLVSVGGTPRTAPTTTVSFSWSFKDAAGTAPASALRDVDVRYRQKAAGATAFGALVLPPALQASTASSTTLVAARGTDTCWQVRARDGAGNISPWSAERCTKVDGTAPTVSSAGAGARVAASVAATTVRFSWTATDDVAVSSYDAGVRTAASGSGLGPWTAPATWQGITATSRTWSVAPGEDACFRVRARDAAGNVSPYSATKCVTVPLDDRALAASAGTTRLADTRALGGTATRLDRSGASVSLTGQTGRQIAVVVLKGPGQGSVEVLADGVRLGSVPLAATSWKRVTVSMPATTFTGAVTVRSTSSAPARVDGLAVLRG
ncbi:hypothetical protein [Kineosporia sp. A_224]|uniref:hypothetical protein n=1 Tax=Kineosporia sp. A_224 TaxID=1962180 RepID=UPI001179DEA8|nr:hypothetical protein [Kineosporia sp. A_224]